MATFELSQTWDLWRVYVDLSDYGLTSRTWNKSIFSYKALWDVTQSKQKVSITLHTRPGTEILYSFHFLIFSRSGIFLKFHSLCLDIFALKLWIIFSMWEPILQYRSDGQKICNSMKLLVWPAPCLSTENNLREYFTGNISSGTRLQVTICSIFAMFSLVCRCAGGRNEWNGACKFLLFSLV